MEWYDHGSVGGAGTPPVSSPNPPHAVSITACRLIAYITARLTRTSLNGARLLFMVSSTLPVVVPTSTAYRVLSRKDETISGASIPTIASTSPDRSAFAVAVESVI